MRKFITTGALFLAVALIPAALPAHAQSTPDSQASPDSKPAQSSSMSNPEMTTVTGCIQAGKREGTFRLVGDDGSMYLLRSKKTDFSQHVGHEVTVTGHVMNGQMHNSNGAMANGSGSSASADQSAPSSDTAMAPKAHAWKGLAVKSMTMVSETCKTK